MTKLALQSQRTARSDLLWLTKPPNGLVFQDVFHRVGFLNQHVRDHWCVDCPWAHRIDANSSGGIFEGSALRQPDHSELCCMVNCPAGDADQTANGRIVDDGAASLFAH